MEETKIEGSEENQINLFGEDETVDVFLTKEDQDLSLSMQSTEIPNESEYYKKGF